MMALTRTSCGWPVIGLTPIFCDGKDINVCGQVWVGAHATGDRSVPAWLRRHLTAGTGMTVDNGRCRVSLEILVEVGSPPARVGRCGGSHARRHAGGCG